MPKDLPKDLPKITTGRELVEFAKEKGFTCEYKEGRPVFYVKGERQRQQAHKFAKGNYGRTYAVHEIKENPTDFAVETQDDIL